MSRASSTDSPGLRAPRSCRRCASRLIRQALLGGATGRLVFIVVGPAMYAFIEGMNYRQVRYEEKDLLRLLSGALATDAVALDQNPSPRQP